jgi:DNA-binding LacI/PurR family transcriptional regulator
VTLKTVAERVGVSPMTVSNAFSRPDQLSAALREKILATAAELGYAGPDPAARILARGATGTVGILFHGTPRYALSDEFSALFLGVIAEELGRGGLALTLLPNAGTEDVVPVRDVAMDGAIVYSCSPTEHNVEWLRRRRLPLVFVDQAGSDDYPTVNVADRDGCRLAADHVLELGHRRIGVLTAGPEVVAAPGDWYVVQERMRGWRDALDAAGIVPVVRYVDKTGEETSAAARKLLAGPDRPTAVLCFSDALAAEVVHAAEELGLRVPDDVSVVGFDDGPVARRIRPALTTVRQDVVEKGTRAAAELVAVVRGRRAGDDPPIRHYVLPTELVVRASTAPPPRITKVAPVG